LIEPLNARDRPDYFVARVEQAADLIARSTAECASSSISITSRSSAATSCGVSRVLAGDRHVQVAAVPSRAEPDEGEVNYPAVFDALDRLGYKGGSAASTSRAGARDGLGWAGASGSAAERKTGGRCNFREWSDMLALQRERRTFRSARARSSHGLPSLILA